MKYEAIETSLKAARTSVNSALQQIQLAKMQDTAVSCRIQIGRYFKLNGNKSVHYKDLATAIGRTPQYVSQILSGYWQFRNVKSGSGKWKMKAPAFKALP